MSAALIDSYHSGLPVYGELYAFCGTCFHAVPAIGAFIVVYPGKVVFYCNGFFRTFLDTFITPYAGVRAMLSCDCAFFYILAHNDDRYARVSNNYQLVRAGFHAKAAACAKLCADLGESGIHANGV